MMNAWRPKLSWSTKSPSMSSANPDNHNSNPAPGDTVSIHLSKTRWNNGCNKVLFGQRHVSNKYCEQWRLQKHGQNTRQEICDLFVPLVFQSGITCTVWKMSGGNREGNHSSRVFHNYDWAMVQQNNGAVPVPDNLLYWRWFYNEESVLADVIFPTRSHRRSYSPGTAGSTGLLEPARGETSLHHHRQWI